MSYPVETKDVNLFVSFRTENEQDYPANLIYDPIFHKVTYSLLNQAGVPVFGVQDFRKTAVEYFKVRGSLKKLSPEDVLHLQGPARAVYAASIHQAFFNGKFTSRQFLMGSMSLGDVSNGEVDHLLTHIANARWVKGNAACKISLRKKRVVSEVQKHERFGGFGSITVISSQEIPAVVEVLNQPGDQRKFLFLNDAEYELTTRLEDYLLTRIRVSQFLTSGLVPSS